MQTVSLHTEDGLSLTAWYQPSEKPTIVYFHGNAGSISDRTLLVMPYIRHGYGVLLVTYRGYSLNPGSPSEEGLYRDGRAALNFLKEKGAKVVLFGESIGCSVAMQMALEYTVEGLILQAPFSSQIKRKFIVF